MGSAEVSPLEGSSNLRRCSAGTGATRPPRPRTRPVQRQGVLYLGGGRYACVHEYMHMRVVYFVIHLTQVISREIPCAGEEMEVLVCLLGKNFCVSQRVSAQGSSRGSPAPSVLDSRPPRCVSMCTDGEGFPAGGRAGWRAVWELGERQQCITVGKACRPLGKHQHGRRSHPEH